MKKEYTWYPDNQERFSEVFDSIEQAIENAQKSLTQRLMNTTKMKKTHL